MLLFWLFQLLTVVQLAAAWPDRDILQLQARGGTVQCFVHSGTSSNPLDRISFDCLVHTALSVTVVFLDDSRCLVVDNVRSSRPEPLRTCVSANTQHRRSWPNGFYEYRKYTARTRTVSLVSGGEVFGYLLDGTQSNMLIYAEAEKVGMLNQSVVKVFFRHFLIAERVNPAFESDFLTRSQGHGMIILGLSPVGLHTNIFPIRQRIDEISDFVLLDDDASNKSVMLRSNQYPSRCTSTFDSHKSTLLTLNSFVRLPKLFSALCSRISVDGQFGGRLVLYERQQLREPKCKATAQGSIVLFDSTRPGIYFRPPVVAHLRKVLCKEFFDALLHLQFSTSSGDVDACFNEGRFPCSTDSLEHTNCSAIADSLFHKMRNATVRVHFDHGTGAMGALGCPSKTSMGVDVTWNNIWQVGGDRAHVSLLIHPIPLTQDIPNGWRGRRFLRKSRNSSRLQRTSVNDISAILGAPFFSSNDVVLRMDGAVEIWQRENAVERCTETAVHTNWNVPPVMPHDTPSSSWWATLLGLVCVAMIVTNLALLLTHFKRCTWKRRGACCTL